MEPQDKKIRWCVATAMCDVYDGICNSKLKVRQTVKYKLAIKRLCELYNLSETQVWILCVACENYIDEVGDTTLKNLGDSLRIPALMIMGWKDEIENLRDRGFLENDWARDRFRPVGEFCNSIFTNTLYVPPQKQKLSGIGLSYAFYIGSKKSDVNNMDKSGAKTMEFASDFLGLKVSLKMAMNLVR